MAILLPKNTDRHPLSGDDQVELAIVVIIHPRGRGHHSGLGQRRRPLEGHVAKSPCAVILQQVASGDEAVLARHDPAAHEEIEVAVSVEVTRHHAGAVLEKYWEATLGPVELAVPVVDVESVPQWLVISPELVPAAHDVEVLIPVAGGVEEDRVDVFVQAVGLEDALIGAAERTVTLLDQQLPGLPLGAADVDVVQAIAIHVTDGEGWSFGGKLVRDERLAVVVEERVLIVFEVDRESGREVREQRLPRRLLLIRIPIPAGGILLRERDRLVDRHIRQYLIAVIRPDDDQRVYPRGSPQAEMRARIDGRLESAGWHLFQQLHHAVMCDDDLRADAGCIRPGSPQAYRQVMVPVDLSRTASVDPGRRVDVVHHQIERAVVVQVHVDRAG